MVDRIEKDHNYWFIPKRYGYGLEPASWQGWLATLGFIALLMVTGFSHLSEEPELREVGRFLIDIFILTWLFMLSAKPVTGGKLGWRWGNRDEDAL